METNLKELQAFWQPVIDDIRENMRTMTDRKGHNRNASGVTAQNIIIKEIVEITTAYVVTLSFPEHAIYLDEGVEGWANKANTTGNFSFKRNKPPIPVRAIRSFMLNRGIVPRGDNGKRIKLTDPEKQLNAIAYRIRAAIKKNGIDRVPFISSVINAELIARYSKMIGDLYGAKIKEEITVEFQSDIATLVKTF